MKTFDIDMCGMGPYIEHRNTPLYTYKDQLLPLKERLNLSFKMIALLRIIMNNINIAATTALQAIEKDARERAIQIGANVLMPNITPGQYQDNYFLYENKPLSNSRPEDELNYLEHQLKAINHEIGYFRQGNSLNFNLKKSFSLNQK
jgi:biotin synthase